MLFIRTMSSVLPVVSSPSIPVVVLLVPTIEGIGGAIHHSREDPHHGHRDDQLVMTTSDPEIS
jgi:hypothetical protein